MYFYYKLISDILFAKRLEMKAENHFLVFSNLQMKNEDTSLKIYIYMFNIQTHKY